MNRNVESGFAYNPSVSIGRSRFDHSHSVKFTMNTGQLIPFECIEVLPGDTFDIKTSKIVRLQTLLTPMMDNLYLDTYWFFVPNRLTWTHWKEFMGENTSGFWTPQVNYSVPQIKFNITYGNDTGSVADYLGVPVVTPASGDLITVNALPFRAYGLIYNEWFRDENLIAPDNVYLGDSNVFRDYAEDYCGYPYVVSKYHDYFTSCLPAPQKGPDVGIPMYGQFPVVTSTDDVFDVYGSLAGYDGLRWVQSSDGALVSETRNIGVKASNGTTYRDTASNPTLGTNALLPANLFTDMNGMAGFNVNELRLAFQVQKFYERDARGGTRYIELLKSHFNVTSPDYRLQRPEYLGGNRIPLNINQVVQNSQTDTTPLGHTGAMSLTSDVHSDFTKSFTEHGFVLGLCCVRYDHTYQQGLERFWSRKTRFDYYFPVFANIGEQAVLNKEIYCDGSTNDDEVFGYQEAWADYRYRPNRVAGEMRSNASTSLDVWHLADDYASLPSLSKNWIQEDLSNVDRVLAVQSTVSNQIFADFYIKCKATRPMPLYSIPGLIDHH